MSEGVKFDGGKSRLSLLPLQAILEVGKVGEMGAKKYGDHNYRKGMNVLRFLDAAFRHQIAWINGQNLDPESGLSHLAHAAWNNLAALEQMMKPELTKFDNRYKPETSSE